MMAVISKVWFPLVLAAALAPAALQAQAPVGELFAGDASVHGSVVLASSGTTVLSGSQVSAGKSAAVLKLQRGGELRICPGTSLSVNTSPTGGELMIGFNTGSLELHYTLAGGSDTVMTPDFRIQMIGPGTFHLALAADSNGTTCVRPLEGSGAGVIVNEILGGGSYQVAPDSAVTFAQGKIAGAKKGSLAGCGCPAPLGPAVPAPAVSLASPPPFAPPPDWRSETLTAFAQGDLVFSFSISSLDHCDGSFLFQNSDSPAFSRKTDATQAPEASISSLRRVGPYDSAIVVS